MAGDKQDRTLEIFFRGIRGEDISVRKLADEYGVSTKSISRSVNDIKAFLADRRDLVGNTELEYSYQQKVYRLRMDEFLTNTELFSLIEVLIGSRAFSKEELLTLTGKLKKFTTADDRPMLDRLIKNEIYHYSEVGHDCQSVQDTLWQLVNCIDKKREITIEYYKSDRSFKVHRMRPLSLLFEDFYFYLIAFETDGGVEYPKYFRVDRIKHITEHRTRFTTDETPDFDEGLLRRRSLFMWPGKLRTIRFEYTGPSVQAVLDKLPTAKIVDRCKGGYVVEVEVYGDGIRMWILSQGDWVKVIGPEEFVEEVRGEILKMGRKYEKN